MPSYLVLLRAGFAWPAGHPAAGGLLPHHFTLTRQRLSGDKRRLAVSFLWHFPSGRPDWVLPSALLCGARTFLQRYLLRRRSPVRLGPAVSLPMDVGKHASRSGRKESAVGDLEDAVDDVADEALGLAVHRDREDGAAAGTRPDLHPPRAAGLGGVGLLDGGGDHRLLPLVALDRPDAEACGALSDPRPAVSALQHLERLR